MRMNLKELIGKMRRGEIDTRWYVVFCFLLITILAIINFIVEFTK